MLHELRSLSARIGADPLLVQAAGGNTSLKQDGVMWIKASGTWLRDAATRDIFVSLDLARLAVALAADDPACEACVDFVRGDINPSGLRPSIETSVHGLMPQRAVVHVHCVNTIALAIRSDAQVEAARLLKAFTWAFVPYARPGQQLCRAIRKAMHPGVDVLILGNHGLVVAADTVAAAEALLQRVTQALALPVRAVGAGDVEGLNALAAAGDYRLPDDPACHNAALDPLSVELGCTGVFYPDHVVFLGTHVPPSPEPGAAALAIPRKGVLVRKDAKPSVEPMLRCLGEVFRRVPHGAALRPLTSEEIGQLLNWDAEKYRQTLKTGHP